MANRDQTDAIATSSVPLLLGVLATALRRHWRFIEHDEIERWLGVVDRLLESYRRRPDALAYVVRQLTHEEAHAGALHALGHQGLVGRLDHA